MAPSLEMTVTLFDAAFPNPAADPQVSGALIYIGGDTPHVWTEGEIAGAHGRYRLPTYVRSNPENASAIADANSTVVWLTAHKVPKGCAVCLDLETAVNPVYVLAYANVLHGAGYLVWPYGSKSTLFRNPAIDGWFVADYTQTEHQYPNCIATQWSDAAGAYDLDDTDAVNALWDLQATAPTPHPLEDDDMAEVWNDGTSLYLFAGGWLTHLNAADEGSDLTAGSTTPFTAQALPYRKVHADLTAAMLASQAARVAAPVVNVAPPAVTVEAPGGGAAPFVFPHTFTVTATS